MAFPPAKNTITAARRTTSSDKQAFVFHPATAMPPTTIIKA